MNTWRRCSFFVRPSSLTSVSCVACTSSDLIARSMSPDGAAFSARAASARRLSRSALLHSSPTMSSSKSLFSVLGSGRLSLFDDSDRSPGEWIRLATSDAVSVDDPPLGGPTDGAVESKNDVCTVSGLDGVDVVRRVAFSLSAPSWSTPDALTSPLALTSVTVSTAAFDSEAAKRADERARLEGCWVSSLPAC